MSLKIYKNKLDYSYSFGVYPTIELLKTRPDEVQFVLFANSIEDNNYFEEINNLCKKNNIRIDYAVKAINKIAKKGNTQVVGVFNKYLQPTEKNKNHVVLVNPSSPGNLGTIIRSMVGFDVINLVIIEPGLDIFEPSIISASVGAFFHINFSYFSSFEEYSSSFPENSFYPFVLNGNETLGKHKFNNPASLIFGNEGRGLEKNYEEVGKTVKISHSKNIESLNLSSSVTLGLYELSRSTYL